MWIECDDKDDVKKVGDLAFEIEVAIEGVLVEHENMKRNVTLRAVYPSEIDENVARQDIEDRGLKEVNEVLVYGPPKDAVCGFRRCDNKALVGVRHPLDEERIGWLCKPCFLREEKMIDAENEAICQCEKCLCVVSPREHYKGGLCSQCMSGYHLTGGTTMVPERGRLE
jgi:hypothetical protein